MKESLILNKKIELIQWLSAMEDENVIEKLLEFKINESKVHWNELSIEEQRSINKGLEDSNQNRIHPHNVVKKIYEKWL